MSSNNEKPDFFPFFPAKFFMDTMNMSDAAVGRYIRLLCLQWNDGSVDSQLSNYQVFRNLVQMQAKLLDAQSTNVPTTVTTDVPTNFSNVPTNFSNVDFVKGLSGQTLDLTLLFDYGKMWDEVKDKFAPSPDGKFYNRKLERIRNEVEEKIGNQEDKSRKNAITVLVRHIKRGTIKSPIPTELVPALIEILGQEKVTNVIANVGTTEPTNVTTNEEKKSTFVLPNKTKNKNSIQITNTPLPLTDFDPSGNEAEGAGTEEQESVQTQTQQNGNLPEQKNSTTPRAENSTDAERVAIPPVADGNRPIFVDVPKGKGILQKEILRLLNGRKMTLFAVGQLARTTDEFKEYFLQRFVNDKILGDEKYEAQLFKDWIFYGTSMFRSIQKEFEDRGRTKAWFVEELEKVVTKKMDRKKVDAFALYYLNKQESGLYYFQTLSNFNVKDNLDKWLAKPEANGHTNGKHSGVNGRGKSLNVGASLSEMSEMTEQERQQEYGTSGIVKLSDIKP